MPSIAIKTVDGLTVYAVFRHASDLTYWNTKTGGPTLEAFNSAHWYNATPTLDNYTIAATKTVMSANVSAEYAVTIPSLQPGVYWAEFYNQLGATPSLTDGQPSWLIEDIQWLGSVLLSAPGQPNGLWVSDGLNNRNSDSVVTVTGNVNGHVTSVSNPVTASDFTGNATSFFPAFFNQLGIDLNGNLTKKILGGGNTAFIGDGAQVSMPTGPIGPNQVTLHFIDQATNPVPNVYYTIVNTGSGKSDVTGTAVFGLANGNYTVIAQTTNMISFPPVNFTVSSAPITVQVPGNAVVLNPSPPGQTTGYLYTRDGHGNILPNTTLAFTLVDANSTVDAWNTTNFTVTSDANGLLQTSLIQLATYRVQWPNGQDKTFTTGSGGTYPIPEVLGN